MLSDVKPWVIEVEIQIDYSVQGLPSDDNLVDENSTNSFSEFHRTH